MMKAPRSIMKALESDIKNNLDNFKIISDFMGIYFNVIDKKGNFICKNKKFAEDFPMFDKDTLLDSKAWQESQKVMDTGIRAVVEEEFNGRYFLSIKNPVYENKKCVAISVISHDITAQKNAEIAKNQFIKSINHDIRTPITGALSTLESLHKKETDESKKAKISITYRCIRQLQQYLNSSLDIAINGKIESKKESFLITHVLNQVIESLMPSIKTKGLLVSTDGSLAEIFFYKKEFESILLNLITNAIKYTNKGGHIDVSAWYTSKIKMLEITVEDTGIGIDEKNLPHIFENFYRVIPSELEPQYNGAGMGLYLVSETVKNLNGTIEVSSTLGKGSRFMITFTLED